MDEARNGREALEVLNREKVDIVLLDIRMPEMDGMEAARHIAGMAEPPGDHLHDRVRRVRPQGLRGERDRLSAEADPRRAPAGGAEQDARRRRRSRAQALDAAANQPRRHLSVHERGKIHLVPIADILYLRAELKYVTVRTAAARVPGRGVAHQPRGGVRATPSCASTATAWSRARAIGGFERNAEESESGWAVVIKATGEKLPVSRRQHHVVKQFR